MCSGASCAGSSTFCSAWICWLTNVSCKALAFFRTRFCARQSARCSNSCSCHMRFTKLKLPLCVASATNCGEPRWIIMSTSARAAFTRCHFERVSKQLWQCRKITRRLSVSREDSTTKVKNSGGMSTIPDSVMRFSSLCSRVRGERAASVSGLDTTLILLSRFRRGGCPGFPAAMETPSGEFKLADELGAVVLQVAMDPPGLLLEMLSLTNMPASGGSSSCAALSKMGTRAFRNSLALFRTISWAHGFATPRAAESKCSSNDTFWIRSKW
mmetsp:Transcript_11978/g.30943  ORF Transcript_11978/g.30943 Transcript_11978/m.30943 type:complete len:270 (-) Transcript_11978:257-1066(-)